MPDANGRFRSISVPRVPWHQVDEPREEAKRQLHSEAAEYDDAMSRLEETE